MNQCMFAVDRVKEMIAAGKALILAGDENVLSKLPAGKWIGGTIPYFVGEKGGEFSQEKICVTELPAYAESIEIGVYTQDTIKNIYKEAPANGFTFVLIPGMSPIHLSFALDAPSYEKFAFSPVVGWITGINLDDLGKVAPKAFDGREAQAVRDACVAMKIALPKGKVADVGIINIFEQGAGDELQFAQNGFSTKDVVINGKSRNFAEYLQEAKADTKLPLVADYAGAMVNVSFQAVDMEAKEVKFYAPVFKGVVYRQARPVGDYVESFAKQVTAQQADRDLFFSCNCILNYLYAGLEGKKTGAFVGPMTFGEVAYQLLNQTLVYIAVSDARS